jgi:hypothetical protein
LAENATRMKRRYWLLPAIIGCFFFACAQQEDKEEDETEAPKKEEPKTTPVNVNGDSELSLLMRGMEELLQDIGKRLEEGDSLTASDYMNYSSLMTVEASPHVNRNELFETYANDWMRQYKSLTESPHAEQLEQLNTLVGACVNCHTKFCPGPVMRINKLKIPTLNQ